MFIFEGMRPDAEAIFSFFACLLPKGRLQKKNSKKSDIVTKGR